MCDLNRQEALATRSELALLTHSKMKKRSPGLVHLLFNRRIKFLSLYPFFQRRPEGGRRNEINRRKKNQQRRRHTINTNAKEPIPYRILLKTKNPVSQIPKCWKRRRKERRREPG